MQLLRTLQYGIVIFCLPCTVWHPAGSIDLPPFSGTDTLGLLIDPVDTTYGVIYTPVTVTPGVLNHFDLSVDYISAGKEGIRLAAYEDSAGTYKELASTTLLGGRGSFYLEFTPTGGEVHLTLANLSVYQGALLHIAQIHKFTITTTTPITVYETVCNEDKDKYRFGFNGKEKDNEVKGIGNSLDYGARWYDTRIARLGYSVDPLTKKFPWYTPYQFAGNKPTWATDLDGKEEDYGHIINTLKAGYNTAVNVYHAAQAVATATSKVLNFFDNSEVEFIPYAHLGGRLTLGDRYAGDLKKVGGVDVNLSSVVLVSFDLDYNFKTNKWNGNFDYIGKNGKVTFTEGVSIDAPVLSAWGIPVGVGGATSLEQKVGRGKVETKKSLETGIGLGVVSAKGEYEVEKGDDKTKRTIKGSAGIEGAEGVIGVVDYSIDVGVKTQITTKNDDD